MIETGSVVCGYEVLESLGRGGFATIYKARGPDGKLVTLKFPSPEIIGDPAVYERFRREFTIGQRLSHPAIARAISLSETPEGICLVLEFAEGTTLRSLMADRGRLSLGETVKIAGQLAAALEFLHSNGVFHRDLKPENIIIAADGQVRILDFGIALLEGARRVTWGPLTDVLGTPDYMSPEQIQGKRGDARTDIYALGTVMYEMLTGAVPFRGDNPLAAMNQHLVGVPTPPRAIETSIPAGVEAIILKAIRRSPDERYQYAAELLEDLRHFETLDLSQFSFRQEAKARGVVTDRHIWILSAIIAGAFVAIVALVLVIVALVRRGG
jgi:serine/threonine-protein kinase